MAFSNLAQAMAEDCASVTNLITANRTLTEQVAMYLNRISTKEADNMALQTVMKNLQGEGNNLKVEVVSLNNSGQSRGVVAANKENGIMLPMWKREGQAHHPTWWSTIYCCIHGLGVHAGVDSKSKRPGHKAEATATARMVGSKFGFTQGL